MKKTTKLLGIIIIIMVLLTGNVQALTIDSTIRAYIVYDDEVPYHYEAEEKVNYKMLEYNGSVLYTLNRDNDIVMTLFTNAETYSDSICEKIIENGYPVKTYEELGVDNKQEAYFATQEAIYAYLENKDIDKYIAENEQGERILSCAKQILEKAKNDEVSFTQVDSEWNIEQTDENYMYKRYKISIDSNIENVKIGLENPEEVRIYTQENTAVSDIKNGDIVKIMVPRGMNLKFKVKLSYEKESAMLYKCYHNSDTSIKYLTWETAQSQKEKAFEVEFKDAAPIIIINYENETKQTMPGSIFSILNESQEIVMQDLQTDEEGMIQTSLAKGKYFLKQTYVKEGYTLTEGMVNFEVKNIETISLNIYNSKQVQEEVVTSENTQINVTEENKKVVENEVTNVTNIHTTNVEKEIMHTTNETNLEKVNTFEDTTYLKNITNIKQQNKYPNKTWKENVTNDTLIQENDITNMSRDEYITYMDYIKLGSLEVPNLPVALKQ